MDIPEHKTRIVCTIGPASSSPAMLGRLILAGMDVARLNFSHGEFEEHAAVIARLRAAASSAGRRVAIMADLPGPKIRIGEIADAPIELEPDDRVVLTTDDLVGTKERIPVGFARLPTVLGPGDRVFLADGTIELEVLGVDGADVLTRVLAGGELRSRKGINLPGVNLGISAFTERDRECLEFALGQGVDAVSQSFVSTVDDVSEVRQAAAALGHDPFIIAKIERAQALDHIEAILGAADGIMVARGDLGVEIPIERIAVVQKELMSKANACSKPVITATHMLESMVQQRRPSRAEATDVANAILDGTDCVMLSAESAVGRFPVEATAMLARIAAATEPSQSNWKLNEALATYGRSGDVEPVDLISLAIHHTMERIDPEAVIVPTRSGHTARNVARFRLPVWVTALSAFESTCQELQFSYGIRAIKVDEDLADWSGAARSHLADIGITSGLALLTQGPSEDNPNSSHRMEILELDG